MAALDHNAIGAAAALLWQHWAASTRIPELPEHCRPADRSDGYAVQAAVAALSGQRVVGWKIAATSLVGQAHIGVDGPLAGRLLSSRVTTITKDRPAPGPTPLAGNAMRVAEAEFAFRLRGSLPARERVYGVQEVLDAVATMHPAIEIPDSRYDDFTRVGAPSSSPTPPAPAGSSSPRRPLPIGENRISRRMSWKRFSTTVPPNVASAPTSCATRASR